MPASCRRAAISFLFLSLLLTGCGLHVTVPARDRGQFPSYLPRPETYEVVRGDTLYSIAWRYRLDTRKLAMWNDMRSPYTIFPGEVLSLYPGREDLRRRERQADRGNLAKDGLPLPSRQAAGTPRGSSNSGSRGTSNTSSSNNQGPTRSASNGNSQGAPTSGSQRGGSASPSTPAGNTSQEPSAQPRVVAGNDAEVSASGWQWPIRGPVLLSFGASGTNSKGLDIGGDAGDEVRAARAGSVVYSGNGLIGYGELIIIKHNDEFLSAYGFNRKRLVAEGESVARGQVIAEIGQSPDGKDALHFEIRRNGKPVDPISYLPKR